MSKKYKKGAEFENINKEEVIRIIEIFLDPPAKDENKKLNINFKITPKGNDNYILEAVTELEGSK